MRTLHAHTTYIPHILRKPCACTCPPFIHSQEFHHVDVRLIRPVKKLQYKSAQVTREEQLFFIIIIKKKKKSTNGHLKGEYDTCQKNKKQKTNQRTKLLGIQCIPGV